jgi:hypothetical protein
MRRLRLPFLVAIFGLAASGYAMSLTGVPLENVVRQNFACPPTGKPTAKNFQVLGTVQWSEGAVVLYKTLCPIKEGQETMQRVFGYQLAKRNGMSWQLSDIGSYGIPSKEPKPENLIEYGIGHSESHRGDRYMIVYGQALAPKVAAVEATFDNGKQVYSKAKKGVFALIAPGADRLCELRVIGNYNQILRRDDLKNTAQPEPATPKWTNRCWRTIKQL